MRIWHQSAAPLNAMGSYGAALARHVQRVASPGTEIVLHGLSAEAYGGLVPAEVFRYAYPRHLILGAIIERCLQAEQEGFDAVALAAFNDPFIHEARSVVDIPVVSMAESSLLTACALARRFALVTLTPENVIRLRDIVDRHALGNRVSGVYALEPRLTERELVQCFESPDPLRASFGQIVERAVADGAELVIPAEGILNEVLFSHGYIRADDVPILDCIGTVFLHAEMMVNLKQRSGVSIGRRWEHAKPEEALLSAVRKAAGLS